jgi:hypothetical protein
MGRTILPDAPSTPAVAPAATAPATTSAPAAASAAETAQGTPATAGPAGATADSGAAPVADGASGPAAAGDAAVEPTKLERAKAASERAIADAKRAAARRAAEAKQASEVAQLRQELEQTRARAKLYDEWETLSRTDRIAAAQKLGLSPAEVLKAAQAEQSPEHQQSALEARLKKQFEEQYGAKIAEQQKYIDAMTAREREAAMVKAETSFQSLSRDVAKYPHLAEMSPLLVLELGRKLVLDLSPEKRALVTNEDICNYLEKEQSSFTTARKTPPGAPSVSTPNAAAGSAQSRTQSNGATGTTLTVPEGFDSWTDSRQKKWMAEQITARATKAQATAPK